MNIESAIKFSILKALRETSKENPGEHLFFSSDVFKKFRYQIDTNDFEKVMREAVLCLKEDGLIETGADFTIWISEKGKAELNKPKMEVNGFYIRLGWVKK